MTATMTATMREMPDAAQPRDTAAHLAALLTDVRPLGARSVIASTLLGSDAARLPADRLVRAGELFGIADGAIRTALWRMVAAGELTSVDGCYELAGRLLLRQQRTSASAAARRRDWDGTWEIAVVGTDRRSPAARHELRTAAAALHLAELREGVWTRPDNLDRERLPGHRATVDAQCVRFSGATAPGGIAPQLFDVDGWAARAVSLVDALDTATEPPVELPRGGLRAGFELSIAVVRHLDHDPLLPDVMLPADWPGRQLRSRYATYHREYERRFGAWLRSTG
jgi:phenylacetic acid degradation operon negative regulatory protein